MSKTIGRFDIPVASIDIEDVSIRPPQTSDPKFIELRNSIASLGIQKNIIVRVSEVKDRYLLVDGCQRLTIAVMEGIETINALVKEMTTTEAICEQLQANAHTVVTKAAAYGRQLQRLVMEDPSLTAIDLANMTCMSVKFINDRLTLGTLTKVIADKVDNGEIPIATAVRLAKLPQDEQVNYLNLATTDTARDAVPKIDARLNTIKEEQLKGRVVGPPEFKATPKLRTRTAITEELENHVARSTIVTKDMKALDAFDEGVKWTLSLDPATVEAERAKFESSVAAKKEKERLAAEAKAKNKKPATVSAVDAALAAAKSLEEPEETE